MNIRPIGSAMLLPLKRLWQWLLRLWLFLKGKTQFVFDFMMDRMVVWLCRYYQPSFE